MNRTLTFLLFAIFAFSCSTPKYVAHTGMLDFKKYNDKGFFITQSNSVSFTYDPVGYITATVYSGIDDDMKTDKKRSSLAGPNMSKYHVASNEDAFEILYERCLKESANGIINVNFYTTKDDKGNIISTQASGMAIKK